MILTMENLINNFTSAIDGKFEYVGVKIKMEGFEKDEVIINPRENFSSKLEYYKNTYDDDLNHKFAKGISISGFTYGDDYVGIEYDLVV